MITKDYNGNSLIYKASGNHFTDSEVKELLAQDIYYDRGRFAVMKESNLVSVKSNEYKKYSEKLVIGTAEGGVITFSDDSNRIEITNDVNNIMDLVNILLKAYRGSHDDLDVDIIKEQIVRFNQDGSISEIKTSDLVEVPGTHNNLQYDDYIEREEEIIKNGHIPNHIYVHIIQKKDENNYAFDKEIIERAREKRDSLIKKVYGIK